MKMEMMLATVDCFRSFWAQAVVKWTMEANNSLFSVTTVPNERLVQMLFLVSISADSTQGMP